MEMPSLIQMIPYLIPVDIAFLYVYYAHGKVKEMSKEVQLTLAAAVLLLYMTRLGMKMMDFNDNKEKVSRRKKKSLQRLQRTMLQLRDFEDDIDTSIPNLPFKELLGRLRQKTLKPVEVLMAYQKQAIDASKSFNAVVDIIEVKLEDLQEIKDFETNSTTSDEEEATTTRKPAPKGLIPKVKEYLKKRDLTSPPLLPPVYSPPPPGQRLSLRNDKEEETDANMIGPSYTLFPSEDKETNYIDGVPISLSEVIHLKSKDSTLGMSFFVDKFAVEDAVVVKVLRAQGALPFVRTNIPQTAILSIASSNPIFGTTFHPLRRRRTPGGTASGEAALIAAKGSILGLGSDLTGGIRIPAHFCGICGLKPTCRRISTKGVTEVVEGQTEILRSIGPLSRSVDGLVAFMRSVCISLQSRLDPSVPTIPFNEGMYKGKKQLKVGFFIDDGYTKCVPVVKRAIEQAVQILEEMGHKVVPFAPPDMKRVLAELYLPAVLGDNSSRFINCLATDQLDPHISKAYYTVQCPYVLRWLYSWLWQRQDPMYAAVLAVKPPRTVVGWWDLVMQIEEEKQKFLNRWQNKRLDVLLCPVLPFASVQLGNEDKFKGCLTHTALFNLLDFPAGTVPITRVEAADLEALSDPNVYEVGTYLEKNIKLDQLGLKKHVETGTAIGLPVGVQIAALPFQEELVLRVLQELEEEAKFS